MNDAICLHKDQNEPKPNTWLNQCARSVTSQSGEDGIVEKILEVIGDNDKWCVEFGSWDGKNLSNTYNLIADKGYSAVSIEGDARKFKDLVKTFEDNPKVTPVNAYVGFNPDDSLDTILANTQIPKKFDVLSIDVDGNDYHIWEAVRKYKPKVVIIEFNGTIPPEVEFVQPPDMKVTQGSSILAITELAKSKGYELVAVTSNAIYVDAQYFGLFGIEDNSVDKMWTDRSAITYIFCGYDGTVFIRGRCELPWQKIPFKESKVQQLPKWARKRVGDRNIIRRKVGKIYRRFRKKDII
jgi:hypothetical protein